MRFLEPFGQHTFHHAAEFLEGTVVIKNLNDSDGDGGSYSFQVNDTGSIITTISSSEDVNWFNLNSTQGSSADGNDPYRAPALIFSKTATDVDGQKEGAIFFGSSGVGGSVASIVGWHHDVSDFEGAIQLAVRTEGTSSGSTPYVLADWHGSEVHIDDETNYGAGNVIKGYANGAGIVNVDLGIGASSTTTLAGNAYITSNIELGHASDTTISRSSAGVVQIEGSTIATAANLATLVTDLHGAGVDGAANQLLTDDGDGTVTSESTLTWDGSMLTVSAVDDPNEPVIKIRQTDTTSLPLTGGELRFDTDRNSGGEGLGNNNDMLGFITWRGHDNQAGGAAEESIFAKALATAVNVANNAETGKLELQVLNPGGSLTTGLSLQGLGAAGHINATVGQGTLSTVTIEGNLNVGGHSVNDIDITSEASDADDHLMTALAIKNRIEDYGLTSSGLALSSATSDLPTITLTNSNTDANPSVFTFQKTATGADNDVIGNINFIADNDADEAITYAKTSAAIKDASDTDEAGQYVVQVATSDGSTSTLRNALFAEGSPSADDVDVTIGHGSTSTTTIGGNLNVNGTDHAFTSSTDNKPVVTLSCGGTAQVGSSLVFKRTATGADNTDIGTISFQGKNDADEDIYYAHMWADTADASDTDEAGTFNIQVACSDGSTSSLQNAFSATGTTPVSFQTEVDVNIGHGEFSKTNIAGSMTIGGANTQGDTFSITANSPTTTGNNGATFKILGSDGNGTNKNGGSLEIVSGASTGTGTGGSIRLNGTAPGSSGSSVNANTSRFEFVVGNTTPYLDIGPQSLGVRSFIDFNSETFENSIPDGGDSRHSTTLRYAPAGTQGSLGVGEIYFLQTNGSWAQADASATSTGATQLLGVIASGGALPSKGAILEGFIRIPSNSILNTPGSGAVDGLPVYVSTTAGHFDFTAPSGNDEYVRCVGYALDDHSGDVLVYFKPDNTFVKITT